MTVHETALDGEKLSDIGVPKLLQILKINNPPAVHAVYIKKGKTKIGLEI